MLPQFIHLNYYKNFHCISTASFMYPFSYDGHLDCCQFLFCFETCSYEHLAHTYLLVNKISGSQGTRIFDFTRLSQIIHSRVFVSALPPAVLGRPPRGSPSRGFPGAPLAPSSSLSPQSPGH